MMRMKSPIDALFPATRQAILATVLLEPGRSWYLSDLTSRLGRRNPSSLQRELASLVGAGILLRRQEGNRVYFQANRDCPIYGELHGLLTKTAGLADIVCRALERYAPQIRLAFIFGSIARSDEHASSDVDLFVVGELGLAQISTALRETETQLGRAINAAVYTPGELAAKATRSHFLGKVLAGEKLFLIGTEHDLAELAGSQPRSEARYEQAGAG